MALIDKVASHYQFDETTGNAIDIHAGKNLTAHGSPGTAAGQVNTGRTFDPAHPDWFDVNTLPMPLGNNDFAFSFWVKPDATVTCYLIGNFDPNSETGGGFGIGCHSFPNLGIEIIIFGTDFSGISSEVELPIGEWSYIAVWFDSNAQTINLIINNNEVVSVDTTGIFPGPALEKFTVGSDAHGDGSNAYSGIMDELTLFDTLPTVEEFGQIYGGLSYPFGGDVTPPSTTRIYPQQSFGGEEIMLNDKFQFGQTAMSSSAPTALVDITTPCKNGLLVKNPASNTEDIYIGDANVSSSTGYPLSPGESLIVPVDHPNFIYGLAVVNDEPLAWVII